MRRFLFSTAVLMALTTFAACSSSGSTSQPAKTAADEAAASVAENEVDCDAFMQQLADSCFAVIAFEEDGTTPLHLTDDDGNDLGEVDQQWAAGYCECYAQLAFQTFGCSTVIEHEKLDDDKYADTYAPIVSACSTPEETPAEDAAPAEEVAPAADAAPATPAEDAAPAENAEQAEQDVD